MILYISMFFVLLTCSVRGLSIENKSFDEIRYYNVQKPYKTDYLKVSSIHTIFYAEFGNPNGVPVVVVHGGPGWGCANEMSAFFDPEYYRVIMFDQRGAGRSKPLAEMEDNTPQASVRDMEYLREYLKINQWIVFGGSYGSLLSLLYGETYPERVLSFVLRGIFLGRKQDYNNLFYQMGKFFPEAYNDMLNLLSAQEQMDLVNALHTKVMSADPAVHHPIAYAFMYYDILCSILNPNYEQAKNMLSDELALSVARAFIHYAANNFFMEDNYLLNNSDRIKHIPAIIVHGRYDLICLPENAYQLHAHLPKSQLWFISNAGHASSERPLASALREAMDSLKKSVNT